MRELTTGRDVSQPPCTCRYNQYYMRLTLPTSPGARRVRSYKIVDATGFTIDPACLHHGDTRRSGGTD